MLKALSLDDPKDPSQLLPATLIHRVLAFLPSSTVHGSVPLVSTVWRAAVRSHATTSLVAALKTYEAALSLALWLQTHGSSLQQASILGRPLFALEPKVAVCKALASGCSNLKVLELALPLSQTHETTVLAVLAPLLHQLTELYLQYTDGPDATRLCCTALAASPQAANSATVDDLAVQPHSTTAAGSASSSTRPSLASSTLGFGSQLQTIVITDAAVADVTFLQDLQGLTHLSVSIAGSGIDQALLQLSSLRRLSLTAHRPSTSSPSAAGESSLVRQGLTQELSSSIGRCTQLTALLLRGFKPASTSSSLLVPISCLLQLRQLDLLGCLLDSRQLIPIAACSRLTQLSLASNDLYWPVGGGGYQADATNTIIGSAEGHSAAHPLLVQLLGSLVNLQSFDVSGCRLSNLDPIFKCCNSLTALHAGAHMFRYHPNYLASNSLVGINMLSQLQMLDLSCNHLRPDCLQHLASLTGLTFLNLAENSFGGSDNLPMDVAPTTTTSSSFSNSCECELALDSSCLQHLCGLQQLQHLDLSSCGLKDISPITNLTSLTNLKLGYSGFWRYNYNKLQPQSFTAIGHLTGLQHLDLHYCCGSLTHLPREASYLTALSRLTHLDVSGCWAACGHIMQSSDVCMGTAIQSAAKARLIVDPSPSIQQQIHQQYDGTDLEVAIKSRVAQPVSCKFPCLQELLMLLQDHTALRKVAACCSDLAYLHMSDGGQQLAFERQSCLNDGFSVLHELTKLTNLSLSSLESLHCVEQIAALSGLKHLKLFSVGGIDTAELLLLTALTSLTCLDITGVLKSDHGFDDGLLLMLERLRQELPHTWIKHE